MAKTIKFNIRLTVDGKEQLVQTTVGARELGKALQQSKSSADRFRDSVMSWTMLTNSMQNVMQGLTQLTGIMHELTEAYAIQEEAETKLETVMRQRMGATEAQIQSVKDLASAQQQQGVIGDEVQLQGIQQLATFLKQKDSIDRLVPAMNNLIAQQKGYGATAQDAVTVGNLMGKAMQGQASALRRVGITFDETQEKVLKYGTESEKAAMLAQIITQNVGNMNSELAKTDAGRAKQLSNALGDIKEELGKVLAPYESLITMTGQLGLALNGIVTMGGGIIAVSRSLTALTGSTAMMGINTRIATTIVRGFTSALRVSTVSIVAGTVAVKALTWALRALEVATVVGAAIAAISMAVEALGISSAKASNELDTLPSKTKTATDSFNEQRAQGVSPLLTKYQQLQQAWKSLKSEQERTAFLKKNADGFNELGVKVGTVTDAEDFLVNNTTAVVKALNARAEAAAAASVAQEEMAKALKDEMAVKQADERTTEIHRNINTQRARAVGNKTYRDTRTYSAHGAWTEGKRESAKKHRANANYYTQKGLEATKTADKTLGRYHSNLPSKTGGNSKGGKNKKETFKPLKVPVDLTIHKIAPVSNGMGIAEELEELLKNAQARMDKATTIKARIEASARVDEIQQQIDRITNGELTIPAEVKPTYVMKGSDDDIRQSYENAQSKGRTVQNDYNIGLIDKDEAQRRIDAINKQIVGLGANLKPIKLEVDTSEIDKATKGTVTADEAIGRLGQSLSSLGEAVGVPELDVAGTMAQAIATMVQGYAFATSEAGQALGPWGWLAFAATGLAQLAAMISSVKGASKYATGGIVGGSSFHGDRITAQVNSGEMILNKQQQLRMLKILSGQAMPAMNSIYTRPQVNPNVGSMMSAPQVNMALDWQLKGDRLVAVLANTTRMHSKKSNIR